ncbi:BCCT family transporter [Desulfococcaceae bacterium HSG7]|nr:BCCT family transporter [Desulfococcaceae bacterium HSG7]
MKQQEKNYTDMVADHGLFKGMHLGMGIASKAMVLSFVLFTVLNVDFANKIYESVKNLIVTALSWYYIAVVSVIFIYVIWLMFSKHGKVVLGDDDEKPAFNTFSWFCMLFSAGLGLGLLYWSVAEPIFHLQDNPFIQMAGIEPMTHEAAQVAMRITLFHWGLHGWAIYVLVGLSLAYFAYRKNLPLTMRSALYPVLGDKIYGPWGHAVDLIAVFGTVFGVATSLGLGVAAVNAGANSLFGLELNKVNQLILIGGITIMGTLSAVSGVDKGVRMLSELNIWLSLVLLLAFLLLGPTGYLLGFYVTSIGDYLWNVIPMGFWTDPDPKRDWQSWWTIFYWGWWVAWCPFVGMFIARISRGRTIRQFTVGVMLAPALVVFLWMAIFGGTALHAELIGNAGIVQAVNQDYSLGLFKTIDSFGTDLLVWPLTALTTFLLITWFVTSSDSGTLVICTMLSMGSEQPPQKFRIFWGLGEGFVAGVLLLAGGLQALQTASIAAGIPITVILVFMLYGLTKTLAQDHKDRTAKTQGLSKK